MYMQRFASLQPRLAKQNKQNICKDWWGLPLLSMYVNSEFMMNQSVYKHLKEEFVSNLSGTSMLEIAALSFLLPAFLLLCKCRQVHFKAEMNGKKRERTWCLWSLIVDFTFVVIPALSILTILNGKVYLLTAVLVCGLLLAFLTKRRQLEGDIILSKDKQHEKPPKLQFLSSYRFVVMLVTCLSILAVDFNIFPRRYAKTETYGTGLMDVGVGSFVVVNALVSRKARGLSTLEGKGHTLRNTGPLLLLGFARLLFTKQVDYQVHVGEYGVHWNFFFTLAAVALLTNIVNVPAHLSGVFGLSILLVYQLCLLGGLNNYLNSTQRGVSLISQNKEGIFSLVGYWGLYLLGVQLGYLFFQFRKSKSGYLNPMGVAGIWALAFLFWSLTVFSDRFLERTSRRSCNLAYALFIVAVNLEGLGVLALLEVLPNMQLLLLEKIITENMLATFLLANLLTGLVNLSVNTIFVSASVAYGILVLYSLTLVAGMGLIRILDLKIKL